jgi:hypothetical protein
VKKRILNYEAECYTCERLTWFTEDLSQTPEHIGGYDMVWADCTVCGFGVKFYGSNAE